MRDAVGRNGGGGLVTDAQLRKFESEPSEEEKENGLRRRWREKEGSPVGSPAVRIR